MVLSDRDLEHSISVGKIIIKPFNSRIIRENGVDFRLSNEIAHHKVHPKNVIIDPTKEDHVKSTYEDIIRTDKMVLSPNEQVLLSTIEYLGLPDDVMGFVELRSTWARHGLSMPPTIIDAGFHGTITLEVINNAPYKILLRAEQRFAHIIFAKTSSPVKNPYSGSYMEQKGIKFPKKLDLE